VIACSRRRELDLTEHTIESREVFSGKVVRLRVDTVRLPDGRQSTREIVVHRGAITAVPLKSDGTVILVRQFRQAAGEALLEIPAGTLEENERPEDCARRELQEEIGYRPQVLTLMFTSFLAPGYSSEKLYTYLAQELEPSSSPSDSDEFLEVVETPLDQAVKLVGSGEIKDAKTICGLLMAQRILCQR